MKAPVLRAISRVCPPPSVSAVMKPVPLACFVLALVLLDPLGCAAFTTRGQSLRGRVQRDRRNIRPNIVLIMTDDQDVELGEGACASFSPYIALK